MTRENARALLPIIQAYAEGKEVQHRQYEEWVTLQFAEFEGRPENYRIKPEPRRFFINIYNDGPSNVVHKTRESADNCASKDRKECIEVIEVL